MNAHAIQIGTQRRDQSAVNELRAQEIMAARRIAGFLVLATIVAAVLYVSKNLMVDGTVCSMLAALITVGFMRSIRREPGARATFTEWFLSAEVGVLVGIFGFVLLR